MEESTQVFQKSQANKLPQSSCCIGNFVTKCSYVAELTNQSIVDSCQKERKHLIDVIRYLRFLARQGIAIQGNPGDNNFTQLLKLLRTKDPSIHSMLEKTTLKYTHNDIQKKLLELKAQQVLHEKLKEISENNFFAIMGDKYTDISDLEQLSMCLRTVSDDLEIQEDFLGFYELNNINSNSIVHAIKDVLLRSNLSLQSCQGQTYDNASNMMGEKSGVATQIKKDQQKAQTHIAIDTHLV